MSKIDELDFKILRELQKDAKQGHRAVANKVKVAEGTVYNRLNKLRAMGVIKGLILDIDYSKLGIDLTAIIGIVVEGKNLANIEKEIAIKSNVSAVYDVTGEYDAIIVAKFKDRVELSDFIKHLLLISNIRRTHTMIVLNTLKEEHSIMI
ncbi:MAG: Lrp/AsnC family transcriptional regulator [Methanosarcinaceae archaeon]|jgi:Lrp/AsnC family transcriptional regulator for asnA, asnC and gidA|nr:Lrp/AsnC family transcriptional regulator [Methanosarcinaceae archaeon]NKQ38871.1 Lrp/AsnC family transcriptional regulator [Methanosarcinales archaeon]